MCKFENVIDGHICDNYYKDTLFFNMENYQNVSSEVVGIYIFNNVNKSKNAVNFNLNTGLEKNG